MSRSERFLIRPMKTRRFLLTFLFILTAFSLSFAEAPKPEKVVLKEATGLEWLQMSMGERQDCVLSSMYVLSNEGVDLSKTLEDYYDAVGGKLRLNPNLYSESVTDILASIVYEKEPLGRETLDKV